MARRTLPEVNAGSMADIAFLLLIFFLVTTTMAVDSGIIRKLPPPVPEDAISPIVNERNVFVVLINKENLLSIRGELTEVDLLREQVIEFLVNPANNPNLSEQITIQEKIQEELKEKDPDQEKITKLRNIEEQFGVATTITKGVISLQNDRLTTYKKYLEVQNEIVGAINDLRDDLASQTWGKDFDDLKEEQQDLIKIVYPFVISEAEPRSMK